MTRSPITIYAYDTGRGTRIAVELFRETLVFSVERATELRDALTSKLEQVAGGELDGDR